MRFVLIKWRGRWVKRKNGRIKSEHRSGIRSGRIRTAASIQSGSVADWSDGHPTGSPPPPPTANFRDIDDIAAARTQFPSLFIRTKKRDNDASSPWQRPAPANSDAACSFSSIWHFVSPQWAMVIKKTFFYRSHIGPNVVTFNSITSARHCWSFSADFFFSTKISEKFDEHKEIVPSIIS